MKFLFCGDVMPGGVLPYQEKYITPELQAFMDSFDFRVATLEAAIGTDLSYDPVKMDGKQNIIYARDEDFFRIKEMGFDVVSLANNHFWDLGVEGMKNAIRHLKENGIAYCGAGMNLKEASCPAVIEKDGLRIAILASCMYGNKWLGYVELAEKDKSGVNPLDIDRILDDIQRAKKEYDYVIVMPHWGREHLFDPLQECVRMAKKMVEAGADAVLGSHPHRIQPMIVYRGKPICFSMGNFLFPDFYMQPPRPIWYPSSKEEVAAIKDAMWYPSHTEEHIRQVWNRIARYGCAIGLTLTKKGIDASVYYVHTSDDNVVSLSELPVDIRRGLFRAKLKLRSSIVRFAVKAKRMILR